jgi:AraC family transcriptional regulator
LTIYFHAPAFAGDAREDGRLDESAAAWINAATQRVLPGVGGIVDTLYRELESPGAFTAEAADCLARLLLVRLARMWAGHAKALSPITPLMLQRVNDYVQASLSNRISVRQMAAVAGLPANRFAQAFTDHTGQSPHQYVLTQRLNMAASLLARSRMSLAEVAVISGFCSQQHLTNTMRLRLGVTPGRYRSNAKCG